MMTSFRKSVFPKVILFFFVGFTLLGCSEDLSPETYLARAKAQEASGDFLAAVIELKNAIQKEPDNYETRSVLGNLYLRIGDGVAAEKELRRAVKLGKPEEAVTVPLVRAALLRGDLQAVVDEVVAERIDGRDMAAGLSADAESELLALRGHAYLGLARFTVAEEFYNSAISVSRNSLEAQVGLARLAGAQGQIEQARARVQQMLSENTTFAPAWSLMGDLEQYEGNLEAAESAYSEAIGLRFNNLVDLVKRAYVRVVLKDLDDAQADIDTVNRWVKRNVQSAYIQGLIFFNQERYSDAQRWFQEAMTYAPDFMPAVFYSGLAHYQVGQLEQADALLSRFLSSYPQSNEATRILAAIRLRSRDFAAAEALLKTVLARNPNDTVALQLLSKAALPQGKVDESIAYLQKVADQESQSAAAHKNLGVALLMTGETEQAAEELEKAADLDPESQEAEYLSIVNYMRARQYDRALAAAVRLRENRPGDPQVLVLMGGAYNGMGQEDKARALFEEALAMAPGDPRASHNLALLELRDGRVEDARARYMTVLNRYPDHLDTLMRLGALDYSLGRVEEARSWVEQAVQKHPDALQPRVALASYYLRVGEPVKALGLLRNLQGRYPTDAGLLRVLGKAKLAAGDTRGGLRIFQRLAADKPRWAHARYLVATAYKALGDDTRMREELDAALKLDPAHWPSKALKAQMFMEAGDMEAAKALLKELETAQARHPTVLVLQGRLALLEKRPRDAAAAFNQALNRSPGSTELILNLTAAKWQANDQEGAIATLKEWLQEHPRDLVARYHLGNSYLLLNRQDEAKSAFRKVVEQSPEHVLALNNLAWLLQAEDPNEALVYAERAQRLAPDAANVSDTLGTVLLRAGRVERAVTVLRAASQLAPENLSIRFNLALALAELGDETQARAILEQTLTEEIPADRRQVAEALLESLSR